jgi:hypothetical protein
MRVHGEFGVKTPNALLFIDEIAEAAAAESERLMLVLTDRPYLDTVNSLRRFGRVLVNEGPFISMMLELQGRLMDARAKHEGRASVVVSIDSLWADPTDAVTVLSAICGISSFSLSDAVRGIEDRRKQQWV